MFRAQFCAVLGLGLMLASASARASQVELSVDNRIGGDNNVFRSSTDRRADGFYTISPRLAISKNNSNLTYYVSYRPTYETYFKTSNIDGFDHEAQAAMTWRPTGIDTIGFSSNYTNSRRIRLEDRSGPSSPAPVIEESSNERVQRTNANLSYRHAVNSKISFTGQAVVGSSEFSQNDTVDSRVYSGQVDANYVWDPLTVLGVSVNYRRRDSDKGASFRFAEKTDIWNFSASIQRQVTPTIDISIQAGPSLIDTKQESHISGIPNTKKSSTSYFASVRAEKKWQRIRLVATYTRSESGGGGTSSASILDTVTLTFNHKLSQRWSYLLYGSWINRKEISASTIGGRREETGQYRFLTSVTRTISDQLSVIAQYTFYNQHESNQPPGSESVGAVHSGFLSLRYTFDPVVF